MSSPLKQRIDDDVKQAMRARDKVRLAALRQVTAALKQREVDERIELDDAAVLAVLDKLVKQRRDSEAAYTEAGREELAAQERFELELITAYMPAALSEDEVAALIDDAITSAGASGMKDMGKVMGALKPKLQGRADLGAVSKTVKVRLSATQS